MSQYTEQKNELLKQLPPELAQFVESQAYERGHSAGEQEVDLIASEVAYDLVAAYQRLQDRLIKEAGKV